ncbi:MAG TPA: c-type cytochrome [Solirubrobacterales bacterium]|jgi:ubiquinol-cytochrome c reductase cytochrome c subunit|nr:c-type cytochrome [Solirubrobacterales bacterium]
MSGRGKALLAAVLVTGLAAAALASAQPPSGVVHQPGGADQGQMRLGAGLYAANCASCHGPQGEGVAVENNRGVGDISAQGPSLVGVGELAPDFYLRTGRMPLDHAGEQPERQRPFFNDREISAITAYVGSFGGGPPIPEPEPDHSAQTEGMSLFTDHCAGCHQIVGEGGYVTGAKVPTLKHADATEIAEAVRIGPFLMPRFPKSQISDDDLNKIIAYVQASKHPEDRGGLGIGHIGPVPEGMVAWLIAAVVLVGVCMVIGRRLGS